MAGEVRWAMRRIECRETKREFGVLLAWRREGKVEVLNGVFCDNPRLGALDNWDCRWSCWKVIVRERS